jgi:NAD(P)-dependent dehydrogenase (short-subunit alcohol dehydrogenase family)
MTESRFSLAGRVAVVTGGSRGIGRAIAEALAEAGAAVVVGSRHGDECAHAAEQFGEQYGVKTLGLTLDLTDADSIERFVGSVLDRFAAVDILVNNSGRSWGADPWDIPWDRWQEVLNVNVTGTWAVTMGFGRGMVERRSGSILNVASVAGLQGTPPGVLNALGYSTSKAAVIGFTRDLAVKWAPYGVRVNAIAPGFFPTRMTAGLLREEAVHRRIIDSVPMGRLGDLDDVKGAAVFFASDASRYVTGQVLAIDGGQSAS